MSTHLLFVTLFLGLVAGPQPLEVKVDDAVRSVAIVLDGRTIETLHGAPWRTIIDLGPAIVPQQLTAIAYDANGDELSRQTQFVNLARPLAEASIILAGDTAEVRWQHLTAVKADRVTLQLDRKPLPLGRNNRATLPKVDRNAVHVLSAQVRFADGVVAQKELVFGGLYADEMPAELSGVLVTTTKKDATPADAQCLGVRVAALERPESLVIFVRDADADTLGAPLSAVREKQRHVDLAGATLRFIEPVATRVPVGRDTVSEVFEQTEILDVEAMMESSLMYAGATRASGPQRLADAVAVAGVRALEGTRRRAVVLLLGRDRADASRHEAAAVRRYLAAVGVPFYVWSLAGPSTRWGTMEDISTVDGLHRGVERLRAALERQRVAWLATDPISALRVAPAPGCAVEPVAHR